MSNDLKNLQQLGEAFKAAEEAKRTSLPPDILEVLKTSGVGKPGSALDAVKAGAGIGALAEIQRHQRDRQLKESMQRGEALAEHQNRLSRAQYERDNPVVAVFEELRDYIEDFEETLNPDEEVGARLINFGQEIKFHIRQLGYSTPCLLHFDGVTDSGHRVRLVQHISQLSVLFIAMPLEPGEAKTPIGFVHPDS